LARLADPARPGHIRHDDISRSLLNHLPKAETGEQPLADTQGNSRLGLEPGIRLDIVGRDDLFEPEYIVRLKGTGDLDRHRQIPAGVALDRNLHFVANGRTDGSHHRQALLELCFAKVVADRPNRANASPAANRAT